MTKPPAVETEFTFIVTYPCPRCHAALEAKTNTLHDWLRCPQCGRASLPPDHTRLPRPIRDPKAKTNVEDADDDLFVIGPEAGRRAADPFRSVTRPGGVQRIILATGFLIALTLLFVSVLDRNGMGAILSGFAAIALFGFLLIAGRRA